MIRVLVVDDEDSVRTALARRLEREGYQVNAAGSEGEGLIEIRDTITPYDVIVTDMNMDDAFSGIRILEGAVARDIFTEVIVLTAYGSVANAVECMKRGAYDYVEKNLPGVDVFELITMKIEQAAQRRRTSVQTIRRLEEHQQNHTQRG